jgi:glutamine synthetase
MGTSSPIACCRTSSPRSTSALSPLSRGLEETSARRAAAETQGLAYGLDGPTPIPTRLEAALDALEKDTVLRGLLGEELVHLFLAVKRHEIAKATEHARDYPADDWTDRVDDFEVAELFEFL